MDGAGGTDGSGAAELSDADLLSAHAAGDPDAFGEVVRRHRDRLWAVALRTLGNREDAADAVQDALVSAFRSGRTGSAAFRGESAVTTWLHRIVVNACLDRVRRSAARPADPFPEQDLPSPGDPVGSRDTALDVAAALGQLPAEQRAALVLVDMYGWSVEDAAEVLECPTGTVKSRCARGRARLRPLLAGNPMDADRVPPATTADILPASTTTTPEGGEHA